MSLRARGSYIKERDSPDEPEQTLTNHSVCLEKQMVKQDAVEGGGDGMPRSPQSTFFIWEFTQFQTERTQMQPLKNQLTSTEYAELFVHHVSCRRYRCSVFIANDECVSHTAAAVRI